MKMNYTRVLLHNVSFSCIVIILFRRRFLCYFVILVPTRERWCHMSSRCSSCVARPLSNRWTSSTAGFTWTTRSPVRHTGIQLSSPGNLYRKIVSYQMQTYIKVNVFYHYILLLTNIYTYWISNQKKYCFTQGFFILNIHIQGRILGQVYGVRNLPRNFFDHGIETYLLKKNLCGLIFFSNTPLPPKK